MMVPPFFYKDSTIYIFTDQIYQHFHVLYFAEFCLAKKHSTTAMKRNLYWFTRSIVII